MLRFVYSIAWQAITFINTYSLTLTISLTLTRRVHSFTAKFNQLSLSATRNSVTFTNSHKNSMSLTAFALSLQLTEIRLQGA